MEDFQKVFIDEANEFIINLEENLLLLENDKKNPEILNEIFRIMHSLKGSGAMFGFNELSNFTHHLENLYDKIRTGESIITHQIIDFTLKSTDHIKNLITLNPEDKYKKNSKILIEEIPTLSTGLDQQNQPDEKITRKISSKTKIREIIINSYFIRFIPDKNIFKDGTNPLYLLDELANMGDCIIETRIENIEPLEKLTADECYFSWDIVLASIEDINSIEDVFIFVADSSEITIELIAKHNVLENKTNRNKIKSELENANISSSDLLELIKLFEEEKNETIFVSTENTEEPNKESLVKSPIIKEKEPTIDSTSKKLKVSTVRVKSENLDNLINLVSELITLQARLQNLAQENGDLELISFAENFHKLSRHFRDLSFEMRLVPIQNLQVKFQRLVHDLSKELNKDINFITEGLETELDKNVIELISEPILHILRNSIDHGIENVETRRELNKPETASIKLIAYYSGADVIIELQDDGKGINTEEIRKKAIDKRLISQNSVLSKSEILDLVFQPGFSTKQEVSHLSGRGVGMDIVKKKIEELRGKVEINSEIEKGTSIRIRLPLTLSMIDGFIVEVEENSFIIPLNAIEKIHELKENQLEQSFNNIIKIEDEQIPFIHLISEQKNKSISEKAKYIVLINFDNKKIGIIVNRVIGESQVVLKPLGHLMKTKEYFSGATILGNGKVALVIDTNKLIQQHVK